MALEIVDIEAAATRPLRSRVLRPGVDPSTLVYPSDDAPGAFHLGAKLDGALVSVISASCEPPPGEDDPNAWRLRGVATLAEHQSKGIGGKVLDECIRRIEAQGGTTIWCNARTTARTFYERAGFQAEGEEFEIPVTGLHYVMLRRS